ncbi:MAG: transposase [Clostridiales bacterium]|jgi:hypothetical protein|nr:transposase [Clostridiales bacterium]
MVHCGGNLFKNVPGRKTDVKSAQYHHIAARRGAKRAAVAVAHSILTIVYYILKRKQPYIELGANYYEERKEDAAILKI